jgi:NTP pyrophosphatase (non-canonical NTP hydrolase)
MYHGVFKMSFAAVEMKVVQWSTARKIIQNQAPATALLKLFSELGELADAEAKGNEEEQVDAVGDIMVCLINYCAIKDYDLTSCLNVAYEEIKDRKGEMLPNGIFVKA